MNSKNEDNYLINKETKMHNEEDIAILVNRIKRVTELAKDDSNINIESKIRVEEISHLTKILAKKVGLYESSDSQ